MKYLSVCSGIEAASVSWTPLGFTPVGFSEIEKFPSEVLKHHYPDITNYGDINEFREWKLPAKPEIIVGGTPCQAFSIAGKRGGLDDPRGQIMLRYLELIEHHRPRWIVWENVPGVLSSNKGRDFGTLLTSLGNLGYGWAYRILDAQWIRTQQHPGAVPQRRRRVFVVGCLGDVKRPAKVLFESQSLCRNSTPIRTQREAIAGGIKECTRVYDMQSLGQYGTDNVASTCKSRDYKDATDLITHIDPHSGSVAPTITASNDPSRSPQSTEITNQVVSVYYASMQVRRLTPIDFRNLKYHEGDVSGTMQSKSTGGYSLNYETGIQENMAVRRLTPKECERLQGFPDDYTRISWNGKSPDKCPDGPRYKALGNSMATNCMEWIGKRILEIDTRP